MNKIPTVILPQLKVGKVKRNEMRIMRGINGYQCLITKWGLSIINLFHSLLSLSNGSELPFLLGLIFFQDQSVSLCNMAAILAGSTGAELVLTKSTRSGARLSLHINMGIE